jgi:hypothetical protein
MEGPVRCRVIERWWRFSRRPTAGSVSSSASRTEIEKRLPGSSHGRLAERNRCAVATGRRWTKYKSSGGDVAGISRRRLRRAPQARKNLSPRRKSWVARTLVDRAPKGRNNIRGRVLSRCIAPTGAIDRGAVEGNSRGSRGRVQRAHATRGTAAHLDPTAERSHRQSHR